MTRSFKTLSHKTPTLYPPHNTLSHNTPTHTLTHNTSITLIRPFILPPPGGIFSLAAYGGDKVVCGGASGVVKVVDLRSFTVLQTFSALPPTVDVLQVDLALLHPFIHPP